MSWMLWYADGSTVSSEDCAPQDVPGYGLIVIAQPDKTQGIGNVAYLTLHGYDWYYWHAEDKEWAGAVGDSSMWDLILHREPVEGVCQGRRVSKACYGNIVAQAEVWAEAQGLSRKSGTRPEEHPL